MKLAKSATLACLLFAGVVPASASSISGAAALALAGVIAPASPALTSAESRAVARLFAGNSDIAYSKKIAVAADKIVCRTSNVDITARSCRLTFGRTIKTITGRAANELYATAATAGVPADGAAGSMFESLSDLSCTLDPQAIQDRAGGGAACSYEAK